MSEPLAQLDAYLGALIAQAGPAGVQRLAREAAKLLQTRNQGRIQAQTTPDGAAFAPRSAKSQAIRAKRGRLKRAMFAKLRLAAHLKAKGTPTEASVGWDGRAARIARVHHEGLRDRVSERNNLTVQYPARALLGIPPGDEEALRQLILEHLMRGQG